MKRFALLLVVLCGCDATPPVTTETVTTIKIKAGLGYTDVRVYIVTNSGHVFAVAVGGNTVAICEVTDASKAQKPE